MKMNGCKTKCEDCPDEAALAQPAQQEPVAPADGLWHPVTAWRVDAAPGGLDVVLAWADGSWRVRLRPEGRGYEREKAVLWWRGLGGGRDAPVDAAGFLDGAEALDAPASVRVTDKALSRELSCRAADGRILTDTHRLADRAA